MIVQSQDLLSMGFISLLEVVLSIDNAIVLALIARHLPERDQRRALTYGLFGAFVFRFVALFFVTELIQFQWIKFVGGAYLLYVGTRHFLSGKSDEQLTQSSKKSFWKTVITIEAMDIAFAVDSILAAAAITTKLWVIFVGGMVGVVMMRFAARMFIVVLKHFPNFENAAYLLILLIGGKLVVDGFHPPWAQFEHPSHPSFIIFWVLMMAAFSTGFIKQKSK